VSALACCLPTSRITNQQSRSTRICITMAFSKGLSDRPDSGLIYRPQQSPREDAPYPTSTTTFPSPLSPLRNLSLAATAAEGRASLQRRFTTNALPTLSPIAQQRRQAADPAMTVSPISHNFLSCKRRIYQYQAIELCQHIRCCNSCAGSSCRCL
jgi:hypothetical protein